MINNDLIIIGGHIDSDDHDEDSLELIPASNSGEGEHTTVSDTDLNIDFQKQAASFLLKAKEEHRLTQVGSIACMVSYIILIIIVYNIMA